MEMASSTIMKMNALDRYIKKHNIKYFSANELIKHHNSKWDGDKIIVPPKKLWSNIIPTLRLADEIREEIGRSVSVYSGYRCPEYNKLVGGSSNSQHMKFRALDLGVGAKDHLNLISVASDKVMKFRNQHKEVGLGIYKNFVHIDVGFRSRFWTG